jgi:tripartite-type tricarboxylate transporter receptor subunit TctC
MRLGLAAAATAILLLAGVLPPRTAQAQAPIVITTSFGPASAADIVARLLAAEFQPVFGQPVVVKNITGAAGTIAAAEVVRAKPDGLTVLFSPIGPIAIQPSFMKNAGYRTTDLAPVCMVNQSPLVMMTPQNSGMRTVADVVARARAKDGAMPFASTGPGTIPHLSMVTFARIAGVQMSHVPYRGPGDVMVAFQTGDVQLMNDHPSSIRMNGLHPIATLAPRRLTEFPEVPTMEEAGYPVNFSIWHGLFAPAATPPAIIARFEAACEAASRAPAVLTGHERIQTPVVYRNARDFGAIVTADAARMRTIIEEGGLRAAE